MVRAVIFDFFGVLVTEGFKQFREEYFANDKPKDRQAIDLINQVDSGFIDGHEFKTKLAELAGVTSETVGELLGNNKPNKQLLDYIKNELKGHYKVSILSNSSEDYPHQLLGEDADLFDDILLSYKYGLLKPQQEIYELAAERLGVDTTECLFTDDSEGHCKGAERAGMKTIYYQNFSQFKTDLEQLLQSAPADN